jgi:hypothetical protein
MSKCVKGQVRHWAKVEHHHCRHHHHSDHHHDSSECWDRWDWGWC